MKKLYYILPNIFLSFAVLASPMSIQITSPPNDSVFCGSLVVKGKVRWVKIVDLPDYRFTSDQRDTVPLAGAPDFTLPSETPALRTTPSNGCMTRYNPKGHKGVDSYAPIGMPIKASYDGKIEFAGTEGDRTGFGQFAYVYYPSINRTFLYAHLSSSLPHLETGTNVNIGDIFAYTGNTGNLVDHQETHLHFGVMIGEHNSWVWGTAENPIAIDPKPYAFGTSHNAKSVWVGFSGNCDDSVRARHAVPLRTNLTPEIVAKAAKNMRTGGGAFPSKKRGGTPERDGVCAPTETIFRSALGEIKLTTEMKPEKKHTWLDVK
jgi:hypothetical protein